MFSNPRRRVLLLLSVAIGALLLLTMKQSTFLSSYPSRSRNGDTEISDPELHTSEPTVDPRFPPQGQPLPAVHPLNKPPENPPLTPLFIGFTRNYAILQQSVLSYIAAGWPPSQIYVIENTGVMDSNSLALLSPGNPFYLPHEHLLNTLGVNVITTPTLLTFAQLQNFYIYEATKRNWGRFFWSHMDSVVVGYEDQVPYQSFYSLIISVLHKIDSANPEDKWAYKFFSYDRLALVNVAAVKQIGGWDTFIPYYFTDCDFYARLQMSGFSLLDEKVGHVYDVGNVLPDLALLFPHPSHAELLDKPESERAESTTGTRWATLRGQLEELEPQQRGGKGEPFYRNPAAFERELQKLIRHGEGVYARKWGLKGGEPEDENVNKICNLAEEGFGLQDMWRKGSVQ
ncbi:hypothetical protein BDZ91DRAFT_735393 [Kalaharituber pfeilii]|nr:hypothetical protein BDZ91DRAFT_735393 [Kalaharituber pfeilii]